MKTKTSILIVGALASVLLASCSDDRDPLSEAAPIEPTAESCNPDFYKTLPDGERRDNLVAACMTRGTYHMPTPQTF